MNGITKRTIILSLMALTFAVLGAIYLVSDVRSGEEMSPDAYVVKADQLTYNLTDIANYRTSYLGDNSKVSNMANLLPVPDEYFKQQYISMETSERPYCLTIYYEPASGETYEGEWPIVTPDSIIETHSRINALVAFSMVDNLDEVTFAYRVSPSGGELESSKYDTTFTFQRASFEESYGDLSVLGENLESLGDVLKDSI